MLSTFPKSTMGPPSEDPDERAAGVMSGSDPYKELEQYLEKVNEEIGEVFEKWDSPLTKKSINVIKLKTPPDLIAPTHFVIPKLNAPIEKTRKYHSLPRRNYKKNQNFKSPETWLENLLSEFNSVIADELTESKIANEKIENDEQSKEKQNGVCEDNTKEDCTDYVNDKTNSYQNNNNNNLPDLISKSCDDLFTTQLDNESNTGQNQETQTSPTPSPSVSMRSDSSEDGYSVTSMSSIEDGAFALSSATSTPVHIPDYYYPCSSPSSNYNEYIYKNDDSNINKSHSFSHSSSYNDDDVILLSSQFQNENNHSINQNCNTIPKSPSVRRKDSQKSPSIRRKDSIKYRTETISDPDLSRPDTLPLSPSSPASLSDNTPSPSSTSLKIGSISSEMLSSKSSSAPLLKSDLSMGSQKRILKHPRSQSDRHLTEIEANEACKWLRAAGFPQYAQMFEDCQFPIDVKSVQKDHQFLEPDSLKSLFKRLECLNKCAKVKMNFPLESINDSDSEPDIAHSNMWTYQKENQRWSRLCNVRFPVNDTTNIESSIDDLLNIPSNQTELNIKEETNEPKSVDKTNTSEVSFEDKADEPSTSSEISRNSSDCTNSIWDRKVSTSSSTSSSQPSSPTTITPNETNSFNHKVPDSSSNKRPKSSIVRWHSFHNKTLLEENQLKRKSMISSGQLISTLTVGQLHLLRRLSLLKLTTLMDKYCPTSRSTGWTWELPKFMTKKSKLYNNFINSNTVFGVPLVVNIQKTGYALPIFIISSFEWLINNASDQIGIFRKPGVRTRIQKLREMADEAEFNLDEVDSQQSYDVADLVKQYFRELPEVLLTSKLSETFMSIFKYIPENFHLEAVSCALILLPDEHREALYLLLHFLREISKHSKENQMTESNVAVCFAPSLFHWNQSTNSPYKKNKTGIPDSKELTQNKAAHDCLYYLIKNYDNVFSISKELLKQCNFSYMDDSVPVALYELGNDIGCNWRTYLKSCMTAVIKEAKEKSRGWVDFSNYNKVDMFYKKINDGHPLRLWKLSTEVEAPPNQVLKRILWERKIWDPNLKFEKSVLKLDNNIELYNYVDNTMLPLPDRNFCVVRSWLSEPTKDSCIIVETSVEHSDAPVTSNSVRAIVLASRYLIEPCGSGKSRILHLSRVDIRGRTCEWYNKCYAYSCAKLIYNIRESFSTSNTLFSNARESKV